MEFRVRPGWARPPRDLEKVESFAMKWQTLFISNKTENLSLHFLPVFVALLLSFCKMEGIPLTLESFRSDFGSERANKALWE